MNKSKLFQFNKKNIKIQTKNKSRKLMLKIMFSMKEINYYLKYNS